MDPQLEADPPKPSLDHLTEPTLQNCEHENKCLLLHEAEFGRMSWEALLWMWLTTRHCHYACPSNIHWVLNDRSCADLGLLKDVRVCLKCGKESVRERRAWSEKKSQLDHVRLPFSVC
jgi:hypothetical protein